MIRVLLRVAAGGLWIVVGGLISCSSIHIETGPASEEQKTANSAADARRFKSEWLDRLRSADALGQARHVKTLIDSTSANFFRYGYRVVDMWLEGSEGRGEEITDTEMRQIVENSNQAQQPLLTAYEDIIEFGVEEILRAEYFDTVSETLILRYRRRFGEVISTVFYPNGSRSDYQFEIQELQRRTEELSGELERDLYRY